MNNEIHEILHTYSGHLELSLAKNSAWCSGQFSVNHFLKLTNFSVSQVPVNMCLTALSGCNIILNLTNDSVGVENICASFHEFHQIHTLTFLNEP